MDTTQFLRHGILDASDLVDAPAHDPAGMDADASGRYVFLEKLGEGGSAAVHRVRDLRLNREVALKCLRPQGQAATARFVREAELAGLQADVRGALEDFSAAIALSPDCAALYVNRGSAHAVAADPHGLDLARADFLLALRCEAQIGRCSETWIPRAAVGMALNSPPVFLPGFGSHVSIWLGAPCIQRRITDFAVLPDLATISWENDGKGADAAARPAPAPRLNLSTAPRKFVAITRPA
jgi:hypothetical protein